MGKERERVKAGSGVDGDEGKGSEELSKGVWGVDGTTFRVQVLLGGNPG